MKGQFSSHLWQQQQNLIIYFAFQQLKHIHLLGRTFHLLKHWTLQRWALGPKQQDLSAGNHKGAFQMSDPSRERRMNSATTLHPQQALMPGIEPKAARWNDHSYANEPPAPVQVTCGQQKTLTARCCLH